MTTETTTDNTQNADSTALAFPISLKLNLLPETMELVRNAHELAASTQKIEIKSADDYRIAAGELQKIKGLAKRIEEHRKSDLVPVNDATDKINAFYKPKTGQLAVAERLLKNGMQSFDDEQERLRRIAAAEAQEKARKEQERLEVRAVKAEEKGQTEKAEALRETAATVIAAPAAIPEPAKVAGISKTTRYKAEVTDPKMLIKAVAAKMLFEECGGDAGQLFQTVMKLAMKNVACNLVVPDDKALNKMATALKDALDYPGVKIVKETSMTSRSSDPFA